MGRHAVIVVAVALVLAGCAGVQSGPVTTAPGTTTAGPTDGDATASGTTSDEASGSGTGEQGTDDDGTSDDGTTAESESGSSLNFYVSDEQNAMSDFRHLNVTITKVGLKRAGGGNANWTTFSVDDRTVDLTRLQGANATRLGTFAVENGTYETVFVHVSEVNGTLTNGDHVRVKLPSEKLQIHQAFTVGPNESVDYVFDISVFKAGKSGKYILKPVISQSGTDKEIAVADEEKKEEDEKDDQKNETDVDETENETATGNETETGNETDENETGELDEGAALNATFVGNVTRGGNATVSVTRNGSAVANATVEVNGEVVGRTQSDGTLTFSVPDRPELEVEIETEDGEAKLKKRFEKDGGGGNGDKGNGGGN